MSKIIKPIHPSDLAHAWVGPLRHKCKDWGGFVFWVNVLSGLGLLCILGMLVMVLSLSVSTSWAQDQRTGMKDRSEMSANLSAEQRLQAIRESLVQLALEGPTQVSSTSFIDESGTLRDSASFTHDMVVRGVRVLAYGQEADVTQAKIVADHQVREQQGTCPSQMLRENSTTNNILHLAVLELAIDSTIKNSDLYT